MRKKFSHIFSFLLAIQVIVATTGATFYRHYCNTEGELMAISAYEAATDDCCMTHHHEENHADSDSDDDGCCDLQYEFRKADSAPLAESLKLTVPAFVFTIPCRFFSIPLPILPVADVADVQSIRTAYPPPVFPAGKYLLPVIQQFRL